MIADGEIQKAVAMVNETRTHRKMLTRYFWAALIACLASVGFFYAATVVSYGWASYFMADLGSDASAPGLFVVSGLSGVWNGTLLLKENRRQIGSLFTFGVTMAFYYFVWMRFCYYSPCPSMPPGFWFMLLGCFMGGAFFWLRWPRGDMPPPHA